MAETKKNISKKSSKSSKKVAIKKSSSAKNSSKNIQKVSAKKIQTVKKIPQKTVFHKASGFIRELLPSQIFSSQSCITDTNILATIGAIFVVAIVILGGFVYSQHTYNPPPPQEKVQPQKVQIASSVSLTSELVSTLGMVMSQIVIPPSEVLTQVSTIDDPTLVQAQSAAFFANAQRGDVILKFTNFIVLYRPSTKEIVNGGEGQQ